MQRILLRGRAAHPPGRDGHQGASRLPLPALDAIAAPRRPGPADPAPDAVRRSGNREARLRALHLAPNAVTASGSVGRPPPRNAAVQSLQRPRSAACRATIRTASFADSTLD